MAKGRPAGLRLETAERRQNEFQQTCLDDLLSSDHRARQVWEYVEGLDLSLLYGRVQTTVSSSGRRRSIRRSWCRCGFTRPWKGLAVPGCWTGCASPMRPTCG